MPLPYENATAGTQALREIEKILNAFGCQSFGTLTDHERGCMVIVFKWRDQQVQLEASWKGYAKAIMDRYEREFSPSTKPKYEQKALDQAKISVCSVLRDWVKGQTTAVECGVLSFEAAFMPHMLLKDGRRVIDAAMAAGVLPAPSKTKVVEFKS
jgi:hypothetical protein